jgi:hypothetical protein
MAKPEVLKVAVNRVIANPEKPPGTFHKLLFTRVGSDSILEFAHMDLSQVRALLDDAKAKSASEIPVTLYVSQRYTMTPSSVIELLRVSHEMAKDLVNEKVLKQSDVQDALEGKL